MGLPQALRWCYSGRVFDAAEAARGGLIEEPLAPEALLPQAMEIAREIADHTAPVAVAVTRQMLWRLSAEPAPWGTLGVDAAINVHLGAGPDVREGVAAWSAMRCSSRKARPGWMRCCRGCCPACSAAPGCSGCRPVPRCRPGRSTEWAKVACSTA